MTAVNKNLRRKLYGGYYALCVAYFSSVGLAVDRTEIAIVDTGDAPETWEYRCENSTLHEDFTQHGKTDALGHGVKVIREVFAGLPKERFCYHSLKWFHGRRTYLTTFTPVLRHIERNMTGRLKAIIIAASGVNRSRAEEDAFVRLLNKGVQIWVAAGNEGRRLDRICDIYPACYRKAHARANFHVIGAPDLPWGNTGVPPITGWCSGADGTSFAVARCLNRALHRITLK